ncbi:MAG: tRNA 5-methoxyuridine(34)/uridine 5-oxyacetic acid(34) synthase CmoB [Woeseiaceae bacterium]|nr:tRNA 5-methoxyuridine(34)/uridine 5-oxyacetic acid(34) synthase CmoB [Woeseiaceae bacterium]
MLDYDSLRRFFSALELQEWSDLLQPLLRERLSDSAHGDFARWRAAVEQLPAARDDDQRRQLLLELSPWRKGPFDVRGVHIDAEWRSDLKWARVKDAIASLRARRVLDVGCGNGYYALRMAEEGAESVLGIDPTSLYVMQFLAVTQDTESVPAVVLPLRLHELPDAPRVFDTTFSMGVLYHQRSPIDHLRQLKGTLRQGGQLVLETIYVPGEESCARTPADRYARMKNVWLLPTITELTTWLQRTGFRDIDIIDESVTTTDEQRSTEWMIFESLAEALDPEDPSRTIEGWPAPRRIVVTAIAP